MKFSTIMFLFSILCLCQADEDKMTLADGVKILEPLVTDCEPKPEREHIEEFLQMKEDAQMTTKCMRHCLFAQFELIDGTQVNEEKTSEMMGMLFNDNNNQLKDIISTCNKENAGITEKCENSHAHAMCYKRELKTRGFDVPTLE